MPITNNFTIVEHEIRLMANVGEEFNSRELMWKIDGMTFNRLFKTLQKLKCEKKIVSTGPCLFMRVI